LSPGSLGRRSVRVFAVSLAALVAALVAFCLLLEPVGSDALTAVWCVGGLAALGVAWASAPGLTGGRRARARYGGGLLLFLFILAVAFFSAAIPELIENEDSRDRPREYVPLVVSLLALVAASIALWTAATRESRAGLFASAAGALLVVWFLVTYAG